jgi:hypothetical protein
MGQLSVAIENVSDVHSGAMSGFNRPAFACGGVAGWVARQRSGEGDLVLAGGVFQVDQTGVATVDEVLGGQQATTLETGMDAGQGLRIAHGGGSGGHVRDHVGALGRAGLGEMSEESRPAGGLSRIAAGS